MWEHTPHLLHCHNLLILFVLDICMLHQLQHQYFQQFSQVFYYNIYILYFGKSNQEEYLHLLWAQTYQVFISPFDVTFASKNFKVFYSRSLTIPKFMWSLSAIYPNICLVENSYNGECSFTLEGCRSSRFI